MVSENISCVEAIGGAMVVVGGVCVVVLGVGGGGPSTKTSIGGSGKRANTGPKKGPSGGRGFSTPEGFLSYSSTVTVTGEGGVTRSDPWIVRSKPGRTTFGAINKYVLKTRKMFI